MIRRCRSISKRATNRRSSTGSRNSNFTATFTQLAVSLGHIFRVDCGDIDMRDIVLNRRILVVNLPALENSDATLAALGKLVVASLRGMMAQLLGVSLDGDYEGEKAGHGFLRLSRSCSTNWPIMPRAVSIACSRKGAASTSPSYSASRSYRVFGATTWRKDLRRCSATPTSRSRCASRNPGARAERLDKAAGQTYATQVMSYQGDTDGAYREARHAERPT